MSKTILTKLTLATAFLLAAMPRPAQAEPVTNLYVIASGQYITCCGIAGVTRSPLPNEGQTHIRLITDAAQESARLIILGFFDAEPVFRTLENGRLHSGYIEFGFPIAVGGPAPGLIQQHYIVSNSARGLRLDGITVHPSDGADMIHSFAHSNVVANLLPTEPIEATIRVGTVEICWPTLSNGTYQVQYRSSVNSNQWLNLQSPVLGNGGTRCVVDKVAAEEPRRFYRVIPVP